MNISRSSTGIESTAAMEPGFAMKKFAEILSRTIYNRQDVREFIKNEALKRFDGNTDILYGEIKNSEIGGVSFRDILISESSLDTISKIERSIPELNIFIPEMPMFDITVESMDCSDSAIPVCISHSNGMDLYLNGIKETTIPIGELPDFNTIVVNCNSIVEVSVNEDNSYSDYTLPNSNDAESTSTAKIISSNKYEVDLKARDVPS
ncbi:MAG: hypothetical protein NC343_08070 [Muribaculum sp.]|nr:hypothetical protein [Muribaculaceae bacterium]MCM1081692.1 hypothetical protein [Muribaculum sp.]